MTSFGSSFRDDMSLGLMEGESKSAFEAAGMNKGMKTQKTQLCLSADDQTAHCERACASCEHSLRICLTKDACAASGDQSGSSGVRCGESKRLSHYTCSTADIPTISILCTYSETLASDISSDRPRESKGQTRRLHSARPP